MVNNSPKKPNTSTPLDPTVDTDQQLGDTYGMNGITQSHNTSREAELKEPDMDPRSISNSRYTNLNDRFGSISNAPSENPGSISEEESIIEEIDNELMDPDIFPPHVIGEQSVSGDMPDPTSDDNTLDMSHEVGLRLNEDEEHPQELDIASEIDKAEEYHRTH